MSVRQGRKGRGEKERRRGGWMNERQEGEETEGGKREGGRDERGRWMNKKQERKEKMKR